MNLIKKLRRQFIFLATLAIFIIVAGALGLINMMGFYAMREHCLDTMTYITQNGGTMPSRYHPCRYCLLGERLLPRHHLAGRYTGICLPDPLLLPSP